jgi:hypothetical protein
MRSPGFKVCAFKCDVLRRRLRMGDRAFVARAGASGDGVGAVQLLNAELAPEVESSAWFGDPTVEPWNV